jgi:hypothetical protein
VKVLTTGPFLSYLTSKLKTAATLGTRAFPSPLSRYTLIISKILSDFS